MKTTYYATKDPDGSTAGLFRVREDPQAQGLWLERLTPAGEWVDDPSLIDEIHELGAEAVDPDEARAIEDNIVSHSPAGS